MSQQRARSWLIACYSRARAGGGAALLSLRIFSFNKSCKREIMGKESLHKKNDVLEILILFSFSCIIIIVCIFSS